jgi:hypothetical protein
MFCDGLTLQRLSKYSLFFQRIPFTTDVYLPPSLFNYRKLAPSARLAIGKSFLNTRPLATRELTKTVGEYKNSLLLEAYCEIMTAWTFKWPVSLACIPAVGHTKRNIESSRIFPAV